MEPETDNSAFSSSKIITLRNADHLRKHRSRSMTPPVNANIRPRSGARRVSVGAHYSPNEANEIKSSSNSGKTTNHDSNDPTEAKKRIISKNNAISPENSGIKLSKIQHHHHQNPQVKPLKDVLLKPSSDRRSSKISPADPIDITSQTENHGARRASNKVTPAPSQTHKNGKALLDVVNVAVLHDIPTDAKINPPNNFLFPDTPDSNINAKQDQILNPTEVTHNSVPHPHADQHSEIYSQTIEMAGCHPSFCEDKYVSDDSDSSEDGNEMYRWDYLEGGHKIDHLITEGGHKIDNLLAGRAPDPQQKSSEASTWWIRLTIVLNAVWLVIFIWWRVLFSFSNFNGLSFLYPILFFAAEFFFSFVILLSHMSRAFPTLRTKTTMNHLVVRDHNTQLFRVAVLIPTEKEKLETIRKAVFGAFDLQLWQSDAANGFIIRDRLRVVILDLAKRHEVLLLTGMLYKFAWEVQTDRFQEFLIHASCKLTLEDAYQFLTSQQPQDFLTNNKKHTKIVLKTIKLAVSIQNLILMTDGDDLNCSFHSCVPSPRKTASFNVDDENESQIESQRARDNSKTLFFSAPEVKAKTTRFHDHEMLPYLIYSITDEHHMPTDGSKSQHSCSKAMALNAALFPNLSKVAEDSSHVKPLIGDCEFVAVNDAQYRLSADFLRKTMPYFFALDEPLYMWGTVGLVQTSYASSMEYDPLYNFDSILHKIRYEGQDGKGAVMADGHGTIYRVDALKGARPDGSLYAKADKDAKKTASTIGKLIGFKTTTQVPFLHTSIELAKEGWLSVHGGEFSTRTQLARNVQERLEELYCHHIGLMQLLFHRGFVWLLEGARVPSAFHRVYAFELGFEWLRALALEVFMFLPIALLLDHPPWNVGDDLLMYMMMYIITALTALVPSLFYVSQKKVPIPQLIRFWQLTFATTYLHFFAFFKVFCAVKVCRRTPSSVRPSCLTNLVWPVHVRCGINLLVIVWATWKCSTSGFEDPIKCLFIALTASCVCYVCWPLMFFKALEIWPCRSFMNILYLLVLVFIGLSTASYFL